MQLRQHQRDALAKLGNGKVLWGGVGTGKSLTAAAYYVEKEAPRDVYVITTAKKRDSLDWEAEFARFAIGKSKDSTVGGVLTVDSWNNIGNYTKVKDAFFIFDEQRLVGSGAWTKAFIHIAKSNRWIMLSATPGDTWLDYIPLFVANGFFRNRTEFKREHVVYNAYSKFPKVDRYIGVGRLVRYRNQLLVHMPYERHTIRKITDVECNYDHKLFERVVKDRWHVYENRPIRDVAELFSVMRKVVNSDSSRLDSIRALMEKHPKLIVFYNFDYELEILRSLSTKPEQVSATLESLRSLESGNRSQSDTQNISGWDQCVLALENSSEDGSPRSVGTSVQTAASFQEGRADTCLTSRGKDSPTTNNDGTSSGHLKKLSGPEEKMKKSLVRSSQSSKMTKDSPSPSLTSLTTAAPDVANLPREFGTTTTIAEGESWNEPKCLWPTGPTQTHADTTSSDSLRPCNSICSSCVSVATQQSTTNSKTSFTGTSTSTTTSGSDAPSPVVVAEWNGHKHQPIPKTDRWVYLVQYVAGSEGWNCIETNAMAFYSLTYSYKNWHQAFGRIDRLNTPFTELHYYVLKSRSVIDNAISKSLNSKKNFNEASFGRYYVAGR